MSDPSMVFASVLVGGLLLAAFWRQVLAILAACLFALILMGAFEVVTLLQH